MRETKRERRGKRDREKGQTSTFPMKERQRPSREGPKCIIFLHTTEGDGKAIKKQRFSSPRHRRAHAAHPQERIPFDGFGRRPLARGERRGEKKGTLRDAREPMPFRRGHPLHFHWRFHKHSTQNGNLGPILRQAPSILLEGLSLRHGR